MKFFAELASSSGSTNICFLPDQDDYVNHVHPDICSSYLIDKSH